RRFLTAGALSAADAFVVHSGEDREELGRRFRERPAAVIPLPAPPPGVEREAARRRLGLEGRVVLFLGLVHRYKGVETLIDAAPTPTGRDSSAPRAKPPGPVTPSGFWTLSSRCRGLVFRPVYSAGHGFRADGGPGAASIHGPAVRRGGLATCGRSHRSDRRV